MMQLAPNSQAFDLSRGHMLLEVSGAAAPESQVLRFEGVEGLSQMTRFTIDLARATPLAQADAWVGRSATFRFATPHGGRAFHGVISRTTYMGEGHDAVYYRVELMPAAWLLTHRYDSRIFQNKTVPQLVREVLHRAGVLSAAFLLDERRLIDRYPKREYCVQYRETDFNFISRLMEEEGISYYFEHGDAGCTMVLGDAPRWAPIRADDVDLPFRPASGLNVSAAHIFEYQQSLEVRPNLVTLRDFNHDNPQLDLQRGERGAHERGFATPLEVSDFPGNHQSQSDGQRRARIRSEELACRRHTAFGRSNCPSLVPARTFRLCEHTNPHANGELAITRVTHRGQQAVMRTFSDPRASNLLNPNLQTSLRALAGGGEPAVRDLAAALLQVAAALNPPRSLDTRVLSAWQCHAGQIAADPIAIAAARGGDPGDWLGAASGHGRLPGLHAAASDAPVYECEFECIPHDIAFRPPRLTPKPLMRGAQTAIVVGPNDEEIYTDGDKKPGLGCVKVLFHWDREGRNPKLEPNRRSDPTCWIRVSQPWAGLGYGGLAIPRIGQEVIVDFLEGDPDRPIVVGRVYNGDNPAPQSLPANKVRTSIRSNTYKGKGFNEITMDDTAGKEHFYMKSQYDKTEEVGNNRNTSVGVDSTELVGNNDAQMVGNNKSTDVTNAYNVTCDTMLIKAGTSITLQCGASRIHMNQAGFITITGTVITSAAAINNSMVAPLTQVVGAAMLAEVGGLIQIQGGATHVGGAKLASLKGGKVDVVADGDNVIQGKTVKIN